MENIFQKYPALERAYKKDNFEIINNLKGEYCYIFVTGNKENPKIVNDDYYEKNQNSFEWKNIASNKIISHKAKKIIFIKDISSKFFKYGINDKINSIDSLIVFLKNQTSGFNKIVVCGMSAGAYLAIILGAMLENVTRILAFGTVFDLKKWGGAYNQYSNEDKSFFTEETNKNINKYFNIVPLLSRLPSYLCITGYKSVDIEQEKLVLDSGKNIDSVWIDTCNHCGNLSHYSLLALLCKNNLKTHEISLKFKNKVITENQLLRNVSKKFLLKKVLRDFERKIYHLFK